MDYRCLFFFRLVAHEKIAEKRKGLGALSANKMARATHRRCRMKTMVEKISYLAKCQRCRCDCDLLLVLILHFTHIPRDNQTSQPQIHIVCGVVYVATRPCFAARLMQTGGVCCAIFYRKIEIRCDRSTRHADCWGKKHGWICFLLVLF